MTRTVTHVLFDANLSGGQIMAQRLGVALRASGWESSYLLPSPGPLTELLDGARQHWETLDMTGSPVRIARRLRARLRAQRPDVLHTHLVLPTQFAARLAAMRTGIPVVTHYHIAPSLPQTRVRAGLYSAIDRLGANRLSAVNIAVADAVATRLRDAGYRHVVVVPNGVPLPPACAADPVGKEILLLGRITPQKGHDLALDALALVRQRGQRDVTLRILGDALTPADAAFEGKLWDRVARDPDLSGAVRFDRAVADAAQNELPAAWCLMLPSRGVEGMPLVLLEALAAGVPVIGTAVRGVPEVIKDGVTGLLVEPEQPGALADAVLRLARDGQLRARVASEGRRSVEHRFSMEIAATCCAEIYDALVVARSRFGAAVNPAS